jgi:hypothetical protein
MKDISLVNDLFDVEDEFFNHQLFSKLIEKGHYDEVIHLINQQKIDPYKSFQFKKVRTREMIFTSLFKEAIESNNTDFIENILKYKPITKTSIKALMKKISLLDIIIDNKLQGALAALNQGKNLAILSQAEEDPIRVMQKAYLSDRSVYSIIEPHFPKLLPEYQLFLSLLANREEDILKIKQEDLMSPLKVFQYSSKAINHTTQQITYFLKNNNKMSGGSQDESELIYREKYHQKFTALVHNITNLGELYRILLSTENLIYPTTIALLTGYDEVYCSLYHKLPKEEFKKQENYNHQFFSSLPHPSQKEISKSFIMLERYKLDAMLFDINNTNDKQIKRIKI